MQRNLALALLLLGLSGCAETIWDKAGVVSQGWWRIGKLA